MKKKYVLLFCALLLSIPFYYAQCVAPTTQASSIATSSVTATTLTLSWTRGNGDSVLVIAKASSAPTDPTNGTKYTANAAYGSGGSVGGGYAVYKGVGTSVAITGLTTGTDYYFAVYEFMGTGTCYHLTELTSLQRPCSSPATQASAFSTSAPTANSIMVSWTRGTGNNILVIAKEGSAPSDPTNGVSYTANSVYNVGDVVGGGTAIYNGTGTTVTPTGLKPSTTYYFAAYEYNTTNTCYNLVQATTSGTTSACTQPTTQASGFTPSSVTQVGMNISWTNGTGADGVLVIAKEGSAPSDPSNGTDYVASATFGNGTAVGGGYVVYKGTATSVSVAGLDPGITYYFGIYMYKSANYCYKTPALSGSQITNGCTVPTTQASAFTSSSITKNSMTIGWTRGNGDKVMVVAKEGSAPSDPKSGDSYSADTRYKKGDKITGNGGYIVYNGTGTSVTVTDLSESTTYYYAIYEYKNTNTCYRTSDELTGNVTTACLPSSSPATAFTTSAVTSTSMTVGWTKANGDKVLVVAKAGSAPSADPTVGTSYTANAAYGTGDALGGGFVVYNGAGSSVNITGLSAGTTYYYAIYDYKNNGICYNLTELTGSKATLCAYPTSQATSFSASGVTENAMTVNWTRGNGDKVLVIALESSAPTDPTIGTSYTANAVYGSGTKIGDGYVIYDGTGTSVNVTGLNASKNYYYAIYEYATAGNCYNLTQLTGTGTTLSCSAPSTQASSFSSSTITSSSMTISWTRGNGDKVLVIAKAGGAPSDPTGGTSYNANSKFGYGSAVGGGFVVYNGTGTSVNITSLSNSVTYYYAIYEYTANGYCYQTAELTGNAATTGCTAPSTQASSFSASSITSVSMTANWTRGNGDRVLVIAKAGGAPTNPTNGGTYTDNAIYGFGTSVGGGYVVYEGSATSVNITGLSASTTYYFAIYEYSSSEKCYNMTALSGNATTSAGGCTPPATQASSLTTSSITTTSMTVGWTRGNGNSILVVARAGGPPAADPVIGTSYSASSTYGSGSMIGAGYVIYDGSSTSVSFSGLTPGATYYFAAYEYNSTGTCYNLTQLSGSATTSTPATGTQGAGAGSGSVAASAMFDINATDKGILLPRVSLTGTNDATTIANPATSLTVYNTNTTAYGTQYDVSPGFYYWDGNVWASFYTEAPSTPTWLKLGNANTVAATDFVGTLDNVSLTFRRNNIEKLRINNATLEFLNTGKSVYIGEGAGEAMGTGSDYNNVAIGYNPLKLATTASNSIAIGAEALYSFNGSNSIAIGRKSQYFNTSGNSNISVGSFSMLNTTGSRNIGIGDSALYTNTSGSDNIAFGAGALSKGAAPGAQIGIGRGALANATETNYNIGIGHYAGSWITTGSHNIAIGNYAGYNNTIANNNVIIGYEAGYITNLGNNVFLGNYAGKFNEGSGNVFIGYQAGMNESGSDKLYIDNSSTSTPLIWGDFSTAGRRVGINRVATANTLEISGEASKDAAGAWLANSDKRIKTDIQEVENATEVIMKLHPVKFKYTKEWKNRTPYLKENDHYYYNFIAQEYQQIFPESVKGSGEFLKGDSTEILQIDTYNSQIFAVKAIQEQQQLIEKNKKQINDLKQQAEAQKQQREEADAKIKALNTEAFKK